LKSIFWNSIKKSLFGLAIFLGVWFILSLFVDKIIVPSPWEIMQNASEISLERDLSFHLGLTFKRLFVGFIVSFVLGTMIGIFSFYLKISSYIENIMSLLQVIPGVIVGTLLLLAYGDGSIVPIGMIFIMITPIVATNTVNGLLDHKKELIEVINVFGGGLKDIIAQVYIPKLIPVFKSNFLVCTALSLKIIILGEFIGCENGLGFLFNNARIFYNMQEVYLYLLLIILFAVAFQIFVQALFLMLWKRYN